jgi:hypothetical protein
MGKLRRGQRMAGRGRWVVKGIGQWGGGARSGSASRGQAWQRLIGRCDHIAD